MGWPELRNFVAGFLVLQPVNSLTQRPEFCIQTTLMSTCIFSEGLVPFIYHFAIIQAFLGPFQHTSECTVPISTRSPWHLRDRILLLWTFVLIQLSVLASSCCLSGFGCIRCFCYIFCCCFASLHHFR